MTRRVLFIGMALAVLVLACRGALLTRFNHRAHLAERPCGVEGAQACLNCTSCHATSSATSDRFVAPQEATCRDCHRDAEAKIKNALAGPLAAVPAAKRIVFSHDAHLEQPGLKGQCVKCHAGAVGAQSGPPLFPPMATCLGCHQHSEQFERGECLGCHQREDLRALKPVSFMSHDLRWLQAHGDAARTQGALCTTCHAQAQCDSCHDSSRHVNPAQANPERIDSTFVHRFDFLSRHAIESQSAPGSCSSCHARTECNACHASRGLSASVRGAQSPHPPGWASGLLLNSHGAAARRDIASCAACHDQGSASNCVTCHKVGAIGGSPHPRGWRSTDSMAAPQCAACHGRSL